MSSRYGYLAPWNQWKLERAYQLARAADPRRCPVLEAALAAEIAFAEVEAPGRRSLDALTMGSLPAIAALADFDSSGPQAWAGLPQMARWARGVVVAGPGCPADHYRLAVQMAVQCGRLLLVECAGTMAAAWTEALATHCGPDFTRVPGQVH